MAYLLLKTDSGETVETIQLSNCGDLLVGVLTAPLGTVEYHLKGEDSVGIPIEYNTRDKATFVSGKYAFSAVGDASTEINKGDTVPNLIYRLQNDNLNGYTSFNFTATVEPSGGFDLNVEPKSATVKPGKSVDVTLTVVDTGEAITPGYSYIFKVSANDGCTTITSDVHTVSITKPVSRSLFPA